MRIRGKVSASSDSGLKGQTCMWKFSIFLMVLGLALYIVGFATPHFCELYGGTEPAAEWNVTSSTDITEVGTGLWKVCREVKHGDSVLEVKCENVTTKPQNESIEVFISLDSYYGLWRRCREAQYDDIVVDWECVDMDNLNAWKPAAKAMACVGLIFLVVGLFVSVVAGAWHSGSLMGFGGVILLLGAVVSAVGSAVFIGEARQADSRLDAGYSTYLALFGCLSLIVGGALQLMAIRSEYITLA